VRARFQQRAVQLGECIGDGEIRQVHRDQTDRFGDAVAPEDTEVGPFQVHDTGIGTQPAAELPDARVQRVDAPRPGVQQRVRESAHRRSDVEYHGAAGIDGQRVEGAQQLDRPAQRARLDDPDGRVGAHLRGRVGDERAVDLDVPGGDDRRRIGDSREPATQQGGERDERRARPR